jgi:carbonic anhydrase
MLLTNEKVFTTYHGSTGAPSTLGAVNPTSVAELILVDGHDAATMYPLLNQNTNPLQSAGTKAE